MGERREAQEGRNICIIMPHLHCCTAKTNIHYKAILPLKNKLKNLYNTQEELIAALFTISKRWKHSKMNE